MGLYERHILPRVLDLACGTGPVHRQREKVVPLARGRVLEVGVGSGLNLRHYARERVEALIGLDPSPELRRMAERRAEQAGVAVEWLGLRAEGIPLDTASVDTVVITYTLCSIDDTNTALAEMRRVLKPDGALLFSEHGLSPDASVAGWQRRITPTWMKFAGGCRLDRDIPRLLRDAGFCLDALDTMYVPGSPRFVGHTFWGQARPCGDAPAAG